MNTIRLAFCLAMAAVAGYAQSSTSLSGTISDSSGGIISGAVVELTNVDISVKRSVTSNQSGFYSFAQVSPGKYRLEASAPGVSRKVMSHIELLVNTPATVAIMLEVGAITQTVAVASEAPQVNTTDAALANAITTQAIIGPPHEP